MAADLLRRTVTENPYIPLAPTEPQAVFLTVPASEILYGGAGGGGKSVALLMAALQYVDVPGYSAILFRRSFTDLSQAEGLIPLSHEWLGPTDAEYDQQQHSWNFPRSGAQIAFGYMESDADRFRYKGPPFQFIGWDELTSFNLLPYRFMFSRRRRLRGQAVPLRTRAATNPGDRGHDWVKQRFIDCPPTHKRLFIPARLEDNPYLDVTAYEDSMAELDPVTRAQMRHGDWDVRPEGNLFKRQWFDVVQPEAVPRLAAAVRAWDLAATEPGPGADPDWTVGAKMGIDGGGACYLIDLIRLRATPSEVQRVVRQTAELDGRDVSVRMEQEPGSSGKSLVAHYANDVLNGFDFRGVPATGDKVTRANPYSAACERRGVKLVRGAWVGDYLDELTAFPTVAHDDQVDATVSAYAELTGPRAEFTASDWFCSRT